MKMTDQYSLYEYKYVVQYVAEDLLMERKLPPITAGFFLASVWGVFCSDGWITVYCGTVYDNIVRG